jgi:hypothetical protein
LIALFGDALVAFLGIITDLLLPTGGQTPLSALMWFGLLIMFVPKAWGIVQGMINSRKAKA